MKQLFRFSIMLLALQLPATASAYDFEVDGIYYNINGNNATVTYADNNYETPDYSGDVTIPETVTYNGTTYSVTSIGYKAFYNCSGLTSVNIPNSVTTIESAAFFGCTGLTSVTIPNSVTRLGDNNDGATGAFDGCTNLTSVTIGNSVTSIGFFTFQRCSSLTNIDIPNSVITIGNGAFAGCSSLTNVTIGNSVTNIGSFDMGGGAFSGCISLASIEIPTSVTIIGPGAFSGCSGLTRVTIPESVNTISSDAFTGCNSITELKWNARNCDSNGSMPMSNIKRLTIGEDVETLGYNMFFGTSGLTDLTWNARNCNSNGSMNTSNIERVYIGENVESLPDNFVKESKVASLFIPQSVASIGYNAFYHCINLDSIIVESGNNVYDSRDNCNAIIETSTSTLIKGSNNATIPNTVVALGNYAFYGYSELSSIVIPNSVTSIGESAFQNCSGLKNIVISNSVSTLNNYTFQGCTGLTSVNIPNSITEIGARAFSDCSGLTSIDIPNSVTTIGTAAFYGCSGLTSINIPNSVITIGAAAFYDCNSLSRVTIGRSVKTMDKLSSNSFSPSFGNCNNIKTLIWNAIDFPGTNRMTKTNIEQVIIGDDVLVLPESFVSGSRVTNVTIPNSVTSIGNYAFEGCSGLTSVTIGNSVTSIGNYAFEGCSGLTSIDIPNSVTAISSGAFSGCSGLTSVDIPNSVTSIGGGAFSGCSGLTSVSIPASVISIGKHAFYNDPMIETVTCAAITPPTWNDICLFSPNVYYHTPLYVPSGKERAYMTDQSWGQFLHIIGIGAQDEVLATSISINQPQMSLIVGSNSLLIATVLPDSTTNKTVIWATSNPNVASIDSTGMVTALVPGSATITATTTDGSNLTALCSVTVNEDMTDFDNYLSISDTIAFHNETIVIPVRLTNTQDIFAFQTDIYLPEGFTIVTDEDDEYIVTPSNRLTSDHILMTNDYINGAIRVICYTPNSLPISGNQGDLFYILVKVPEDAVGDYTIRLQNTLLTTNDYNEFAAPNTESVINVKTYIPGDANDSRTVTVTDIVVTAQYILQRDPQPFVFEAADMNGDGNITVTDIMLIAYLINHPAMDAPKRMPALESGLDRMSGDGVTLMAGETRTVSIVLDNETDYTAFQMDLTLPEGLTASNFQLTDRAGGHAFEVNAIGGDKLRALCYSPTIEAIGGHSGALLTFDVTATSNVDGSIIVDGIELVTTGCQTVLMNGFAIGVNSLTSVNEVVSGKTVAAVEYYNLAGQQIDRPQGGVTLVVTTYTDGTRSTTKVIK